MFEKSTRDGTNVMIAFIDMDGLKPINDYYGHDEGDFALQKLAEILSDIRIGNAVCARFGGDEFIMFATDIAEESGPAIEEAFCKRIAEVNQVIHKPYTLSASIGTIITKAAPDTKLFSLIAEADKIMYEQKKRKKTSRYLRKD
jgi:diguanylate cyclase (GGDEF)-like protein